VSTITLDATDGDTFPGGDPGSMRIQVPFSNYEQEADVQHAFACPVDLSNRTLFVRIKVDSGFTVDPSYPGGFILSVSSGATRAYASSVYMNLSGANDGEWLEVDLNMSAIPFVDGNNTGPFDPTQVVAVGLHFNTGSSPATGGAPARTPATFHIDTLGFF
jgi:hypothetical protein